MSAFKKSTWAETQFGADPNYATYVSLRPLATDPRTIEIRFETTFAKSKDPSHRQVKGQHFMNKADRRVLRAQINALLATEDLSMPVSVIWGAK